ncbi:MAG TPA: EAL domain-containing protein [Casimicrobiaceae bacterium]|jgi:diguanylate cyclase (GGDEF)-like protein|nr:EAL domain-containing protein [Casimicrobiaceae bacterium]
MISPEAGTAAEAPRAPRGALRRLKRHLAALGGETIAPINLPPVRLGLFTKLQLLTVGLIFVTAATISGYEVWAQTREEGRQLRTQGRVVALMLADLAEYDVYTRDQRHLASLLDSLGDQGDIAYVAVADANGRLLATRYLDPTIAGATLPAIGAVHTTDASGRYDEGALALNDRRFVDIVAPIGRSADAPLADPTSARAATPAEPIGYVRVGMSFERRGERIRASLLGALLVVAAVTMLALLATMFLTRRLVAPMRRLIRAARAVGGGRLDVYVPASSSDEMGLLTHTFNHMTQRLAESQSQVTSYQRTLEDKVAQRTKELEIATAHAFKLAQHDILTGLPNRSLLNSRLKQILSQAQREHVQVACLFLDFDHFKRINDTLGHDAGDQLLQAIAQRLTSAVRESDTVARLGGDEFVIVLPDLDPAHATFEVMTVIARIRESFLAPFRLANQVPTLTCSIGVSIYPLDAQDAATLIKQADTAMYAAKEAGRNAYRFYTADMNARVQQRLQLETDMRRGLMDDEFFLVYQPQIDMKSGHTTGVEALLRWRDPERGVIAPAEFIPIAEESGMIQALGARVLRDACRQLMLWHNAGMMLRLSVNLSVQQLQHDSWLSVVEEALKASKLAASYLDLEITESVIITHPDKAVATLVKLKQMGVSITVDDFGTGYSSLSYLARLPIQSVKIDQRFVRGLEQNRNDEAITQAIIALSHSLGLRVIAEGVETAAQYEFLKRNGCEEAQGFLIAHPLEETELRHWWFARERGIESLEQQPDLWRTPGFRHGA